MGTSMPTPFSTISLSWFREQQAQTRSKADLVDIRPGRPTKAQFIRGVRIEGTEDDLDAASQGRC
jgi:hypothetical protein